MHQKWKAIWESKLLVQDGEQDLLAAALRLDGYDSPTAGGMTPATMEQLARTWRRRSSVADTDSIYELGCGAGAFLEALQRTGLTGSLAGSDYSRSLVAAGRRLFPLLELDVADAAQIPLTPRVDHVTAVGVFLYFPDLAYAQVVIERMQERAMKTVSVLDLPDLATRGESEAYRRGEYSADEYEEKYAGLEHLYFDRDWVHGLFDARDWQVTVEDQDLAAYGNAPFRFNLYARRTSATTA